MWAVMVGAFLLGTSAMAQQTVTLERQKTLSQVGTNAVPLSYQFSARVVGVGIQNADVTTPSAATFGLLGNAVLRTFSTNYPSVSAGGSGATNGADLLNATFPLGAYLVPVTTATTNQLNGNVTTKTTNHSVALGDDFTTVNPVVTNLASGARLAASQTFSWPPFAPSTAAGFTSFTLLEGSFDTNFVASLATNGLAGLTNLTLLTNFPSLNPASNSVQVTGIATNLDHLALLEFHDTRRVTNGVNVLATDAITVNLLLYRGYPPPVTLSLAITNSVAVFTWPVSAGRSYYLVGSSNLTNFVAVPAPVNTNVNSEFVVTQPATDALKVFQLRAD